VHLAASLPAEPTTQESAPQAIDVDDHESLGLFPTDKQEPRFRENPTKAYWWQFCLIAIVNSINAGLWAANFLSASSLIWTLVVSLGLHFGSY
jgi:hypothetical protein